MSSAQDNFDFWFMLSLLLFALTLVLYVVAPEPKQEEPVNVEVESIPAWVLEPAQDARATSYPDRQVVERRVERTTRHLRATEEVSLPTEASAEVEQEGQLLAEAPTETSSEVLSYQDRESQTVHQDSDTTGTHGPRTHVRPSGQQSDGSDVPKLVDATVLVPVEIELPSQQPPVVREDPSDEVVPALEIRRVNSTAYCLQGTMANGEWVHDGAVAMNGVPFGTQWRVQETGRTYTVKDRIGHSSEFDIWMASCYDARQWGRRNITIERIN